MKIGFTYNVLEIPIVATQLAAVTAEENLRHFHFKGDGK